MIECARCLEKSPNQFDSYRYPIHFCSTCRKYIQTLAIVQKIRYRGNYSFLIEAIYMETTQVLQIYFFPRYHLLVQNSPTLIPKKQLSSIFLRKIRLNWPPSLFYEELYGIEWGIKHSLDQIIRENEISKKPLY